MLLLLLLLLLIIFLEFSFLPEFSSNSLLCFLVEMISLLGITGFLVIAVLFTTGLSFRIVKVVFPMFEILF